MQAVQTPGISAMERDDDCKSNDGASEGTANRTGHVAPRVTIDKVYQRIAGRAFKAWNNNTVQARGVEEAEEHAELLSTILSARTVSQTALLMKITYRRLILKPLETWMDHVTWFSDEEQTRLARTALAASRAAVLLTLAYHRATFTVWFLWKDGVRKVGAARARWTMRKRWPPRARSAPCR